jgi:hypothetical protein
MEYAKVVTPYVSHVVQITHYSALHVILHHHILSLMEILVLTAVVLGTMEILKLLNVQLALLLVHLVAVVELLASLVVKQDPISICITISV